METHNKELLKINKRRESLFKVCPDIKNKTGIEIGALCYPTVTREESNILYLDHLSKEELIRAFGSDYACREIVDVDIITRGAPFRDLLQGQKFDYFIANHVIEHIPDLIGWFKDIHQLLNDGGIVFLAVPDKRFTFDKNRPETSCGHIVVDFENKKATDGAEHYLDALIYHIAEPAIAWQEIDKERLSFVHHHHVFNYETFLDMIIKPLIRLWYLEYSVVEYFYAPELDNEFIIILKKENDCKDITILGEKAKRQEFPASSSTSEDRFGTTKEINDIILSGMFRTDWYLQQYPLVAKSGLDPLKHYFYSGYKDGYNPSPDFDSRWYLQQNQDVAEAGYNPFWHYIFCGKGEGRLPKPQCDN